MKLFAIANCQLPIEYYGVGGDLCREIFNIGPRGIFNIGPIGHISPILFMVVQSAIT
jgi:hypothetical protein